MTPRPTPHQDKLKALLVNTKLQPRDIPRVEAAIKRYDQWKAKMHAVIQNKPTPDQLLNALVEELNAYKLYVDLELIFDSPEDFLYRQKGQLKLDNSVIEEFLPWLCNPILMTEIEGKGIAVGASDCICRGLFRVFS